MDCCKCMGYHENNLSWLIDEMKKALEKLKVLDNVPEEVQKIIDTMVQNGQLEEIVSGNLIYNQFNGKSVAFIGDSTVYGDNTTGGQTATTLPSAFEEKTNCIPYNYGRNGMTITGKDGNTLYNRIRDINFDKDYVILLASYNDWNTCAPIGEIIGVESYGFFKNALYYNLLAIINKCPETTRIYVCTMLPSGQSVSGIPNENNVYCESYVKAMEEVCYKLHIPVINLFNSVPINKNNFQKLFYDMTHPKASTYKMIADSMLYAIGSGEVWNNNNERGYNLINFGDFVSVNSSISNGGISLKFEGSKQNELSRILYNMEKGTYSVGMTVWNEDTKKHNIQVKIGEEILIDQTVLNGKNYIQNEVRLTENHYNENINILCTDMTTSSPKIEIIDPFIVKGGSVKYHAEIPNKQNGTMLKGTGSVKYVTMGNYMTLIGDYTTTEQVNNGDTISNIRCGKSDIATQRKFIKAYNLDNQDEYIVEVTTEKLIMRSPIPARNHIVFQETFLP